MVSKLTLSSLFGVSLVVANITAAKLAWIGGVAIPAGFVAIAFSFLVTDLISELYGKETAASVVRAGVLSLAAAWGLIYAAVVTPGAPFYDGSAFRTVMMASSNIVLAGLVTTLVSQTIDVRIFHTIRSITGHRYKWVRNICSTGVSQFIDTAMFMVLGFMVLPAVLGGASMPIGVAISAIIGQYLVKLVFALLDTPVFYLVTSAVDRNAYVESG